MQANGNHPLRLNPADPLGQNERAAHELFRQFSAYTGTGGFTTVDAINAAAMLLVNALRQDPTCSSRAVAEQKFDQIMTRTKELLAQCYDAAGRKKGVFPFDQSVSVPFMDFDKDKVFRN